MIVVMGNTMRWEEGRKGEGVGKRLLAPILSLGSPRPAMASWWRPFSGLADWAGELLLTLSTQDFLRHLPGTSLMKAITPLVPWVVKWLRHWPTRESYFQVVRSGMDKLPSYNGGAIQGLCERDAFSLLMYSKCWECIKSSCHLWPQ